MSINQQSSTTRFTRQQFDVKRPAEYALDDFTPAAVEHDKRQEATIRYYGERLSLYFQQQVIDENCYKLFNRGENLFIDKDTIKARKCFSL